MGSPVLASSGTFTATAYGPPWGGIQGGGVTATGVDLRDNRRRYIVAADPSVLPAHSQIYIWPNPYNYSGPFQVEDTGGAIKGHRIDFYVAEGRAAQSGWGTRSVKVSSTPSANATGNRDVGFNLPDFLFGRPKKKGDKPPLLPEVPGVDPPKAFSALEDLIPALLSLIGHMLDPGWWLRVLEIIGGGILILYGMNALMRTTFGFSPAAKATRAAAATVAVVK